LLYLEAVICGVVSVLVIVFFRGEAPSPPSAAADLKARVNQMKGKGLRPLAFVLGVFSRKPPAPVDESEALQVPLVVPPETTSAAGAEYDSEAKPQGRTAEAVVPPSEPWRMDSYQHGGLIPGVGDGDDDADLEEDDEDNELLNNITVQPNYSRLALRLRDGFLNGRVVCGRLAGGVVDSLVLAQYARAAA
jgi:hypothetical protein